MEKKQIISQEIEISLQAIKSCQGILDKIKSYPLLQLNDIITAKTSSGPLGKRSLYWFLSSINTILRNKVEEIDFMSLPNEALISYILKNYDTSKLEQTRNTKDYFWSISFYQSINELFKYFKLYVETLNKLIRTKLDEKSNKTAELTYTKGSARIAIENDINTLKKELKVLSKRQNKISEGLKEIKRKFPKIRYKIETYLKDNIGARTNQQFYLNYWAFKVLIELNTNKIDKDLSKQLYIISKTKLSENIAYYSCNSPNFNQINLAISTNLLSYKELTSLKENDKSLEFEKSKAFEICFDINRKFFEKRFVLELSDFLVFNSIPFEDVLIMSEIHKGEVKFNISIISHILDYIEKRYTEYDTIGITDESTKEYPKPSFYFTAYSIVLLTQLIVILKTKMKNQLINNMRHVNSSLANQSIKELDFNLNDIYDTNEKTISFIQKKISENHGENNSILLFGPPGTGKTFLVERITGLLSKKTHEKWTLITFAPSLFLTNDSYSCIIKEIEILFDVLLELENCVFFFDEAEELIRKRQEDDLRFGRMFTASMLLFLNKIKFSKSYFVFATNFIDKMDDAAIRKGRFAIRKGVGWLHNNELSRYIKRYYSRLDPTIQSELRDRLKNKPIKELNDIRKALEDKFAGNTITQPALNAFFSNIKAYIDGESVKKHDNECKIYDDSQI